MPELTPKQQRAKERAERIAAERIASGQQSSGPDFAGSVTSKMDQINIAESIEELDEYQAPVKEDAVSVDPEDETIIKGKEDAKVAEVKEDEEGVVTLDLDKEEEGPLKEYSTEEDDPNYEPKSVPKTELELQVQEQNERIKIENMSEIEKFYHDNLDEVTFKAKDALKQDLQELEDNDDSYDISNTMSVGPDGPSYAKEVQMTPEAKAKRTKIRKEYNELVRPANEAYLEVIKERKGILEDYRKQAVLNGETAQSSTFNNLKIATHFLDKAQKRVEANLENKGGWGAILDESTDKDFYTGGVATLAESANLLLLWGRTEMGITPSPSEVAIFQAMNMSNDALQQVDVNEQYSTLSNVMQTLPWMAQMAATAGVGKFIEKGASKLMYKGLLKATGVIGKKGVKPSVVRAVNKAVTKGGAYVAGTIGQVLAMPSTSVDVMDRYMGDVEVETNDKGEFVKAYVRQDLYDKVENEAAVVINAIKDNPESYKEDGTYTEEAQAAIRSAEMTVKNTQPLGIVEATYKGVANNALELFTERFIGAKFSQLQKSMGLTMPKILSPGKRTNFFNSLKKTYGYDGFASEMVEEEVMIPMNALLVGDSKYSDLWDMHQQRELFLQVATTGVLMGGLGGIVNIPSRIRNNQFYKDRNALLKEFNTLKKSDPEHIGNIIDLAATATTMTGLVQQQQKLVKEGKTEQAKVLGKRILSNQILQAFDTHTIEDFEDALTTLSKKPDINDQTKANIIEAQATISQIRGTYEKHKDKRNVKAIMRLEANKLLGKKAKIEMDNQISDARKVIEADIDAFNGRDGFKKLDIAVENLFNPEYEATLSGDALVEYRQYLETLEKQEIGSIQMLERLQAAKAEVIMFEKDNRILFNEATSPTYQKKLKQEANFNKKINKSKPLNKALEENDQEAFNKEYDKIAAKHKGILSKKKIADIKEDLLQNVATGRVKAQIETDKKMKTEADAQALRDKEAGEQNPKKDAIAARVSAIKKEVQAESNRELTDAEKLNEEFRAEVNGLQHEFEVSDEGRAIKSKEDTSSKKTSSVPPKKTTYKGANTHTDNSNQELQDKVLAETKDAQGFMDALDALNIPYDTKNDKLKIQLTRPQIEALAKHVGIPDTSTVESHDAPRKISTTLSERQKQNISTKIQAMYDLVKTELGKNPTFKDVVTKYANVTSMEQADEFYDILKLGWQLNGYGEVNFETEYNKFFDPFKALALELMEDSSLFEDGRTEKEV